jgi:signal peptidase II
MTNSDLTQPNTPTAESSARDRIFWSVLMVVAVADVISKRWAERVLALHYPEEVIGHWLRWTLTYNTGAAMNLSVGSASRIVFSTIAVLMLGYLFFLYRQSHRSEKATPLALALIAAGAFGNLVDRLRHTKGVVDFIDVGTESWRFWTFNVADMGVTVGAVLLALLMWRDERAMSSLKQDAATTVSDVASPDASPTPRSEP